MCSRIYSIFIIVHNMKPYFVQIPVIISDKILISIIQPDINPLIIPEHFSMPVFSREVFWACNKLRRTTEVTNCTYHIGIFASNPISHKTTH